MRGKTRTGLLLLLLTGLLATLTLRILPEQGIPHEGTGGTFRATPGNPGEPALRNVTLHLDNGRVNRLNARRDNEKLHVAPELFGENAPFPPLLSLEVTGPGNLHIKGGKLTGRLRYAVPPGDWHIEVYPTFAPKELFQGIRGQKEDLKIWLSTPNGKYQVDTLALTWSGPEDLFLSNRNLIDLAALAESKGTTQTPETIRAWLEAFGKRIESENLAYETLEPERGDSGRGWQPIRSLAQMKKDGRANCLDVSVWIGQEALKKGWDSAILVRPGHAITLVSPQGKGNMGIGKETIAIEGTKFLKPAPTPKPTPKKETRPGEKPQPPKPTPTPYRLPPPREPEPDDSFLVYLPFWTQLYRKEP